MLKGVHLTLMMGQFVPKAVPRSVIDALISVQVTSGSGQHSGFQLVFATSKTSPITNSLLPGGFFDPSKRVIIAVTINGSPNVLIDGVITQQAITPSNDPGQSTLTITGEDVSRMMDIIDLSGLIPYPAMPAEARVALILAHYAMYGVVPLIIPSILIDIPNPVEEIPAHQGTDLKYINKLASNVGYVFYIEPGPEIGMNIAYWGPEIKTGPPQPPLNVNMDAQTNVESLSFSFDGFSKTTYLAFTKEKLSGLSIPIPVPDITPLCPPLGQKLLMPLKVERLKSTSKYGPIRTAVILLAKASQKADVISGSGQLDVLRYGQILKSRRLVSVRGAGSTYDGLYYVKSVTHNIKRGEYKQSFTLSRNALIASSSRVSL